MKIATYGAMILRYRNDGEPEKIDLGSFVSIPLAEQAVRLQFGAKNLASSSKFAMGRIRSEHEDPALGAFCDRTFTLT